MGKAWIPLGANALKRTIGEILDEIAAALKHEVAERYRPMLDAGARMPAKLDERTAPTAVTVAKQGRLAEEEVEALKGRLCAELFAALKMAEEPFDKLAEEIGKFRDNARIRLSAYLKATGVKEVRNDYGHVASFQAGGGRRKIEFEVDDPGAVPFGYLTVDEEAVRTALEKGEKIPGIRVVEREKSLVVR